MRRSCSSLSGTSASSEKCTTTAQLYNKSMGGNGALVPLPLDNGMNVEAKDIGKETTLQRVSRYEHQALVQLLVEKEADIEAENSG